MRSLMLAISPTALRTRAHPLVPGVLMSAVVAAAATFLSDHYKAPVMLFALLLGMAVNFLAADGPCRAGIEFTARAVLRIGVALLGMRITFSQIAALGWHPVVLVVLSVAVMFLGGTIHDVAQVVGAGYGMSPETGDAATVVKLMRVAMLLPVIVCATMIARSRVGALGGKRPPMLPWFAVAFVMLAAVNSTGWIPSQVQSFGNDLSRWCLVIAISALGMKTQLKELANVGFKPIVLMVGETVFLAGLVIAMLRYGL